MILPYQLNLQRTVPVPVIPRSPKVPSPISMAALFESQFVLNTRGAPPVFQYGSLPPTQGFPVVAEACGYQWPTSRTVVSAMLAPLLKVTAVLHIPVEGSATKRALVVMVLPQAVVLPTKPSLEPTTSKGGVFDVSYKNATSPRAIALVAAAKTRT